MRKAMPAASEQPISLIGRDLINDLSALPENEDIITDFLLERLQRGQIYTWVGSLLLTLNPNNEISTSHLYNSSEFNKYTNISDIYEANPHIFTVAAKAHYNLTKQFGKSCQVIIISGETGTGKTYNAFKCLEFLSTVNKNSVQPSQDICTYNTMIKITDACRLISAFTTACTEKNEVSSRHGQLVRLHYKGGIISGATIDSFLFERSRVTRGSHNFQIFYQMIFGLANAQLETFYLSKDDCYDILSVVDYTKGTYYQESFQDTLKALDISGFEPDQQNQIFHVLALLIHMGNIKFVKNGETCAIDLSSNKSKEALKNTCTLSSLTEDTMIELLTTILINPQSTWRKHTSYHRHLVTVDACRNRLHSIIRHMYDLLFRWILNHINNTLSLQQEYSQWLGILDIFGFESFDKNGIEQLCVNYANEKMQQYFIESYVENSHKDLQEEGFITNCNSLNTINLYKKRLNIIEENLFLTLNDACQTPVEINMSTIIQLTCKNLNNVQRKFLSEKEGNFIIEHYSGPVAYSIKDLLSRNADKVPNEISLIFNISRNKFLRTLINSEEEQHFMVKTTTKKKTMLAKLKYNMDTLIKELSKCDLHYVRCVRPNRSINNKWDRKDFKKQLACIGVFDALPLVKCKYPIRLRYRDFYLRYSKKNTEIIDRDKCKLILEAISPKKELDTLVHFGNQLIFLTESVLLKLETYRRNYRVKCINKIQTFWIKYRYKTTSRYVTNDCQMQNVHKTSEIATHTKFILDRGSRKSNNSEEEDEVFRTSSPLKNKEVDHSYFATKSKRDVKDVNLIENSFETHSESKNNDTKIKHGVLKKHLDDITLHISSTNTRYADNDDEKIWSIRYDAERNFYTIRINSCTFFYKNGILSRRRLAAIPIRMHTRATCLTNSHILPRSALPQGLQDCL
ncbi:Unconventional myosin-XIX [Anthophora retusa]